MQFPAKCHLISISAANMVNLYQIPLSTIQDLYLSIPRKIQAVLVAKEGPNTILGNDFVL